MATALTSIACERTLNFVDLEETIVSDMTLNAFAETGVPLRVFLNRAYPVKKIPVVKHYDWVAAQWGTGYIEDNDHFDYEYWDYYKETALYDADIKAVVNGSETYSFTLAADSLGFICDYVPREGDHIVLKASQGGQEVSAETTVPAKPKIEIVEKQELSGNPYREMNGLVYNTDSIMRITCRISDAGGKQYYRLRVRGERDDHNGVSTVENPTVTWFSYYIMQDIFFSSDALFVDNRLNINYGGWPALFSNVFDNTLINGEEYTFSIDSPKHPYQVSVGMTEREENEKLEPSWFYYGPKVMVELQAISPELYRYYKSVELYRITASDAYAEPVYIYGNVNNGWGIFGSFSYDRHMVEYDDSK